MGINITESSNKIAALREQMNKLKEEASAAAKATFGDACKELFKEHPKLVAFKWNQYTPYFMDGEPCEFGVNDLWVRTTDQSDEDGEYGDGFVECNDRVWDGKKWVDADNEFALICKDVRAVFDLLDEDDCLEMFGDHVEITVNTEGVETEGYNHD